MRGSVFSYETDKGKRWRGQVEGPRQSGKRDRHTEAGFRREKDAWTWVNEQIARLRADQAVHRSDSTVAEYLEWWHKHKVLPRCSPKTSERYKSLIAHVTSKVGKTRLQELTALALEQVYAEVRAEKELSAKTVHHIHGCMHSALRQAVKKKLLPFNPADGCELPKLKKSKKASLEPDQVVAYMQGADAAGLGPIVRLAAATGARRGEVLALRWQDVDWQKSCIYFRRALVQTRTSGVQFKGTKGGDDREVVVDPAVIELLRIHREKQEQEAAMFGEDYLQNDLVFARPDGDYHKPDYVGKRVLNLGRELGLPHVGMHIMRHSHGSILISAGTPIPTVSERLGHSDPYTTMKIYAHALPSDKSKAAETWSAAVAQKGTSGAVVKDSATTGKVAKS